MQMSLLRLACAVTLLSLLTSTPVLAAAPAGDAAYGVGLRVEQYRDDSRPFRGRVDLLTGKPLEKPVPRPVQALIWYPAEQGGTAMQYGQYERYAAAETDFTVSADTMDKRLGAVIDSYAGRQSRDQVEHAMHRPVLAVPGARPAKGTFPVVIYAASFSAHAHENAALCEYLASHGYIVVASASVGRQSVAMTDDADGVQTQAADISFLIGKAANLPGADTGRVGVAGFSWGGLSNVVAAGADSRITALVSLDGSVRYYPELVKNNPQLAPERFATPLLYLAARPRTLEQLARDKDDITYSFINASRYADRYVVTMESMLHGDFAESAVRFMPDKGKPLHTRAELQEAHRWMYRYVLAFLDAYLKKDESAHAFLQRSPLENGIPRRLLFVDTIKAAGTPATTDAFALELGRHGFAAAEDVYKTLKARDAAFTLPEAGLNDWGYLLLRKGQIRDAIAIFKLMTVIYPDSSNAHDSLAEGYERDGAVDDAIASLKKALECEPANGMAKARLAKLSGQLRDRQKR